MLNTEQIHEGHRQRLKTRFHQNGLEDFNEINALELLLFYCIPKQDTNEIAHALINRFGSFAGVLDASQEDLKAVKGIGDHAATFFKMIRQAGGYYQVSRQKATKILSTIPECIDYLRGFFEGRTRETVFLLCMDAKCKVLSCEKVGEGSVNSASVPIRKIVEMALKADATAVVLAHNHPSGLAFPSGEDVQTTNILARTLQGVDIVLTDHIIFADDDSVSLVQSNHYRPQSGYIEL